VWWLTPIIPATGEAKVRKIVIPGQPREEEVLVKYLLNR
jgi:hypothetical protein